MERIRKILFSPLTEEKGGKYCRILTCLLLITSAFAQAMFLYWKIFEWMVRYRPIVRFFRQFSRRYCRIWIMGGCSLLILAETLLFCVLAYFFIMFLRRCSCSK